MVVYLYLMFGTKTRREGRRRVMTSSEFYVGPKLTWRSTIGELDAQCCYSDCSIHFDFLLFLSA